MKSRGDSSQRGEESERGKTRSKKMQVREKVGKSRNTVFFRRFVAPESRKVGSLKRRVRGHLGRWEMKSCTSLWREADFEVKRHKTPQRRSTFGSCDVEKVHGIVAGSTFGSQNVQNIACSEHFWKLRCWKSARCCGAKHISKPKVAKHVGSGAFLEVEMLKKCTLLWREAHFQLKSVKNWGSRRHFGRPDVVLCGRRSGLRTVSKVTQTFGFCSIFKNDGRRGTFEEDLQRCFFRGRRSTRGIFSRDVRRSRSRFPERGCISEHQIISFVKMIFRDRCSTSYDLDSCFRGRRNTLETWHGKIAKRIGTRPSALRSTFHFWRKSRRIASFSLLSTSKSEKVSQNCFVFDVVQFKKLKKCRRNASLRTFHYTNYNFTTLHYNYTSLHCTALHYTTTSTTTTLQLHHNYTTTTTTTTPELQLQLHYNCTTTTVQLRYNYMTVTTTLQLHYTTLD